MGNEKTEWTHREQVMMDGVSYEVKAREAMGGFYGAWECAICNDRGESGLESATAPQAIERAKVSLYAHHLLIHRSTDAGELSGGP